MLQYSCHGHPCCSGPGPGLPSALLINALEVRPLVRRQSPIQHSADSLGLQTLKAHSREHGSLDSSLGPTCISLSHSLSSKYVCTRPHTHTHARVNATTHIHMHTCMHPHPHIYTCTQACTHTHTYTHAHMHAHTFCFWGFQALFHPFCVLKG